MRGDVKKLCTTCGFPFTSIRHQPGRKEAHEFSNAPVKNETLKIVEDFADGDYVQIPRKRAVTGYVNRRYEVTETVKILRETSNRNGTRCFEAVTMGGVVNIEAFATGRDRAYVTVTFPEATAEAFRTVEAFEPKVRR